MSTLTCRTSGCMNQDRPIELDLTPIDPTDGTTSYVDSVICGPCRQPITDIDPPPDLGAPAP